MSIIAIRIKALREEQGITQDELGSIINLSQQQISSFENGSREPNLDKLVALCKYFKVSLDYMVGLSIETNTELEIDDELKKLLLRYTSLNSKDKKLIAQIIDLMKENEHHLSK